MILAVIFYVEHTLNRHGIYADKIDYHYYHGGHMMYVHEPASGAVKRYARVY